MTRKMMTFGLALCAGLLCVAGCHYGPEDVRDALASARTEADERRAFDTIWWRADYEFTCLDGSGNELPGHSPDWRAQVKRIRFLVEGDEITYEVVSAENILLLGQE